MDALHVKLRRERIKQQILDLAKPFIKEETNELDTKAFFEQNPYYKNKMNYYFGSMREFYETLGVTANLGKTALRLREAVSRQRERSVRNMMANERLTQLIEQGYTLQQIGDRYGVSKQCIFTITTRLQVDNELL